MLDPPAAESSDAGTAVTPDPVPTPPSSAYAPIELDDSEAINSDAMQTRLLISSGDTYMSDGSNHAGQGWAAFSPNITTPGTYRIELCTPGRSHTPLAPTPTRAA